MNIDEIKKINVGEKCGIYFIKNKISKNVYIGQSKNVYRRLILHKHRLLNNKHSNTHLQRSFNKYGKYNFKFGVIEYCNLNNITEREKFYINNQNKVYNTREATDSVIHKKRKPSTIQTRLKISNANKGKIPKNLKNIQELRRRKVKYYINGVLIKTFDSCRLAADYFNMKPNVFNMYIGLKKPRKSKYFPNNYKLDYYE